MEEELLFVRFVLLRKALASVACHFDWCCVRVSSMRSQWRLFSLMRVSSSQRTASIHALRVFSFLALLCLTQSFKSSSKCVLSWLWSVVSSNREVVSLSRQFSLTTFWDQAQKDSLLGSRHDFRISLRMWSSQSG